MTMEDVRRDLNSIKYYYTRQRDIDAGCKAIGVDTVEQLIRRYNKALENIPIKYLDTYIGLYVQGTSQESLAEEMNCCPLSIKRYNKKLIEYLQQELSKNE